jgi:hypothetical protein
MTGTASPDHPGAPSSAPAPPPDPAPAPAPPAPPGSLAKEKPCVGVLFVHGAGDHGVGATLIEFGEPMVAWLDGWLSQGDQAPTSSGDAARAGATQILVREADKNAPAHSTVSIRSKRDSKQHIWLLAEARWDEAFTPPAFRQVLLWAIGVVPWTILTQFISPVVAESNRLRPDFFLILRFFWNIFLSTVLALVVSVIVVTVALLTVVLSIIPLDPVRDVVGALQRFASTGVGDLYLVLTSPIQRAALTSAVQRDIDWLRCQGCTKIAVVAHSQGGYVAYQALADPWFRPVETLVTFGSGLIRLTESEQARRQGFLPIALVGVLGAALAVRFGPAGILGTLGIFPKQQAEAFAFLVGIAMAVGIPLALNRYQRGRAPVPDLPTPISWSDYVTDEDPVLNGTRKGRLPNRVRRIRIRNHASVIGDHSSYWQNADQFVSQVAIRIGSLDEELRLLAAGAIPDGRESYRHLERAWERRDERVAVLQRVRRPIAIATGALLVLRFGQLESLGQHVADLFSWVPSQLVSWLPDILQSILPIARLHLALLGAATIVLLSWIGYRVSVAVWDAWSRADTVRQWKGLRQDRESPAAVRFYVWTAIHLAVIALVALVGIDAITSGLSFVWEKRDPVVQAWARLFLTSLTVAAVFLLIAWMRSGKRPPRPRLVMIAGGTSLAIAVELAIGIGWPGPTPPGLAILGGIALEVIGLGVAAYLMPSVSWLVGRFVLFAQQKTPSPSRTGAFASRIDRLGVLGIVFMWIAAGFVVQAARAATVFGIVLAVSALLTTALMATNAVPGRKLPRFLGFLRPGQPTPPNLRAVGWAGIVTSIAMIGIGVVRVVMGYAGPR